VLKIAEDRALPAEISNRSSLETGVGKTATACTTDMPPIMAISDLSADTCGSAEGGGRDGGGVASGELQQ